MSENINLQPAIDILEQERAGLAAHLAQVRTLPALSAISKANGLQLLNERRLASYTRAIAILRAAGGDQT